MPSHNVDKMKVTTKVIMTCVLIDVVIALINYAVFKKSNKA